ERTVLVGRRAHDASDVGRRQPALGAEGELAAAHGEFDAVEAAVDLAQLEQAADLGERGGRGARLRREVRARGDPRVGAREARRREQERDEEDASQAHRLLVRWYICPVFPTVERRAMGKGCLFRPGDFNWRARGMTSQCFLGAHRWMWPSGDGPPPSPDREPPPVPPSLTYRARARGLWRLGRAEWSACRRGQLASHAPEEHAEVRAVGLVAAAPRSRGGLLAALAGAAFGDSAERSGVPAAEGNSRRMRRRSTRRSGRAASSPPPLAHAAGDGPGSRGGSLSAPASGEARTARS